jgi:hypothetical protein
VNGVTGVRETERRRNAVRGAVGFSGRGLCREHFAVLFAV